MENGKNTMTITAKNTYLPVIMGIIAPILRGSGFTQKRGKFEKSLSQDIDVRIWPMILPYSNAEQLNICLTLYVYSDSFARIGRRHAEPTREWYASAIEVYVLNIHDLRANATQTVRSEEDAILAGETMKRELAETVLPLVESIQTAEDICRQHELHEYRLHIARPEAVQEWIDRFRNAAPNP